ncbi:MAG: hypothetical protein V3U57_04110 [Robiginitomaculum sp.]
MVKKIKPVLSKKEIKARTEVHPAAVPFLWLANEKVVKRFFLVPLLGVIVFTIWGIFKPLHHPAPWDVIPGSYAIVGFVAYSFVVLASWPLFKLLSRPENYYGEGDDD